MTKTKKLPKNKAKASKGGRESVSAALGNAISYGSIKETGNSNAAMGAISSLQKSRSDNFSSGGGGAFAGSANLMRKNPTKNKKA